MKGDKFKIRGRVKIVVEDDTLIKKAPKKKGIYSCDHLEMEKFIDKNGQERERCKECGEIPVYII